MPMLCQKVNKYCTNLSLIPLYLYLQENAKYSLVCLENSNFDTDSIFEMNMQTDLKIVFVWTNCLDDLQILFQSLGATVTVQLLLNFKLDGVICQMPIIFFINATTILHSQAWKNIK